MADPPKYDAHATRLQRRLAAEVRAGMADAELCQADLSRMTGIGEPHISLLLRGLREGTVTAWDKLLNAAQRGEIVKPKPDAEKIAAKALKPIGVPVVTKLPVAHRASASLNPRRPS